ncbi:hypothetical protein ACU42Y_02695 [Proteus mirabilis]
MPNKLYRLIFKLLVETVAMEWILHTPAPTKATEKSLLADVIYRKAASCRTSNALLATSLV